VRYSIAGLLSDVQYKVREEYQKQYIDTIYDDIKYGKRMVFYDFQIIVIPDGRMGNGGAQQIKYGIVSQI
jgi:hypothetical protein